jgi:hypothetical protein
VVRQAEETASTKHLFSRQFVCREKYRVSESLGRSRNRAAHDGVRCRGLCELRFRKAVDCCEVAERVTVFVCQA